MSEWADPGVHKEEGMGKMGNHQSIKGLLAAGAVEHQAIQDVGGRRLVASVTDADGNVIGLIQAS